MSDTTININGRNFPADFERISEVKSNDKILIYDSATGLVMFATPAQINAKFADLVVDITRAEDAADRAEAAEGNVDAACAQAVADATAAAAASANAASGSAGTASQKATDAGNSASAAAGSAEGANIAKEAAQAAAAQAAASSGEATELNKRLGKFNTTETVALAVGQAGKYVNTSGGLTSNANFAVSAVVHLTAGRIYLLASDSALGASVAAFAKVLTGTEEVNIAYVYTYDNAGRPVTAVADYDAALVYTFHYDEDGNLESITDAGGSTVDYLPATRSVAYTRYRPLFFSGDQLPTAGFYVYNCIEDEDIVVSAHTASISGQSLTGVHYDVFTAIAYALKDRVEKDGDEMLALAQLVAILSARLGSLETKLASGFGSLSVDNLRVLNRLDDFSTEGNANAHGEGAPNFIPDKPGQRYRDDVAKITYTAQDCKSVSDWKPDTNA